MEGDDILSQIEAFENRMLARTAQGRKFLEQQSLAKQRDAYKKLLERPDLVPEQRTRLQKFLEDHPEDTTVGFGFVNKRRPTEDRGVLDNAARGVASGVVKGFTGAARDLGSIVPDALGGEFLRRSADESAAIADETFDPQGVSGGIGELVGNVVGAAPEYMLLSHAVAGRLLKILPKGSKLAGAVRNATSGSLGQRLAGQGAINLPIATAQSILAEDGTVSDRVKSFGINMLATELGAAAFKAKPPKGSRPPTPVTVDPEAAAAIPGQRTLGANENLELVTKAIENKKFEDWLKTNRKTVVKAWNELPAEGKPPKMRDYARTLYATETAKATGGEAGVGAGEGTGLDNGGSGVGKDVGALSAEHDPVVANLIELWHEMPEGKAKDAIEAKLTARGLDPAHLKTPNAIGGDSKLSDVVEYPQGVAVQTPDGRVFTATPGATHADIVRHLIDTGVITHDSRAYFGKNETKAFGFVDGNGNYLTRDEAAKRASSIGVDLQSRNLGGFGSEDLPGAAENANARTAAIKSKSWRPDVFDVAKPEVSDRSNNPVVEGSILPDGTNPSTTPLTPNIYESGTTQGNGQPGRTLATEQPPLIQNRISDTRPPGYNGGVYNPEDPFLQDPTVQEYIQKIGDAQDRVNKAKSYTPAHERAIIERDDVIREASNKINREDLFKYLNKAPYTGFWSASVDDMLYHVYREGMPESGKKLEAAQELLRFVKSFDADAPDMDAFSINLDMLQKITGDAELKDLGSVIETINNLGEDGFARAKASGELDSIVEKLQHEVSMMESVVGKELQFTKGSNFSFERPDAIAIDEAIGNGPDALAKANNLIAKSATKDRPLSDGQIFNFKDRSFEYSTRGLQELDPETGYIKTDPANALIDEIKRANLQDNPERLQELSERFKNATPEERAAFDAAHEELINKASADIEKFMSTSSLADKRFLENVEILARAEESSPLPEASLLAPQPEPSTPAIPVQPEPLPATSPAPLPAPSPRAGPDFLEGHPHEIPISEMSLEQLDVLKEKTFQGLDENPRDPILQADIAKLTKATLDLKKAGRQAAVESPLHTEPPPAPIVGESAKFGKTDTQLTDAELQVAYKNRMRLATKKPASMNNAELQVHADDLRAKIEELKTNDPAAVMAYQDRLDKIVAEQANRTDPPRSTGAVVNMPAHIGGSLGGYFIGGMFGDTDEERRRNAMIGALVGFGAGHVVHRFEFKPKTETPFIPGSDGISKYVKSTSDIEALGKKKPFLNKMEAIYQSFVQPFHSVYKAVDLAGGKGLPAQLNAYKRMASYVHRVINQSEEFFRGTPYVELPDGSIQRFTPYSVDPVNGIMNLQEILSTAQGDMTNLGNYMAAMTTIEQHALYGRATSKINLNDAIAFSNNAPDHIKLAAKEARKYNRAILDVLNRAGVVGDEDLLKMSQENWYAPMQRIMDRTLDEAGQIIGTGKSKVVSNAKTTVFGRVGADNRPIRNPFESMIRDTPKAIRAAELNQIKTLILDLRQANPGLKGMIAPEPGTKISKGYQARVKMIKESLQISDEGAKRLATAFDPDNLTSISNKIQIFRNGSKETWRVDPYIAQAFQALSPPELDMVWNVLGAPAQLAKTGIVNNPVFIAWQGFRDIWQSTINTQYNVRFGIDWIRGWTEGMRNTQRFRDYGGQIQLQAREVLDPEKALNNLKITNGNALYMAARYAKHLQIADAYHALTAPVSEAARVGEYLRALDHGASTMEAVFAANQVVGNFRSVALNMRALNHMTLFANPAIRALDQGLYAAGVNPFRSPEIGRTAAATRYAIRAVASISIPSFYFYHAAEGDQLIQDVRMTDYGRRFWWMRLPGGGLAKIPKPQFEGQVFGTSVESALDMLKGKDPAAFAHSVEAIGNDVAFNLLPVIGVIPASLIANKDLTTGRPIVPEGVDGREAASQATPRSSAAGRIVANTLSPISEGIDNQTIQRWMSPAGFDYLVRGVGGTLANEMLQGVTMADAWVNKRYLLPKNEWPVIRQALAQTNSTNVEPIATFYDNATTIDRRAREMKYLAKSDVTELRDYMIRHRKDIAQISMYAKHRDELADLRQAMDDLRNMPGLEEGSRRKYYDAITKLMVESTRQFNVMARAMTQ